MSSQNLQKTQISITVEVRDEIKKQGTKGETYDDVLRRKLGMTTSTEGVQ